MQDVVVIEYLEDQDLWRATRDEDDGFGLTLPQALEDLAFVLESKEL